eukprot:1161489-Pelagomonas_calceolata.AAC.4
MLDSSKWPLFAWQGAGQPWGRPQAIIRETLCDHLMQQMQASYDGASKRCRSWILCAALTLQTSDPYSGGSKVQVLDPVRSIDPTYWAFWCAAGAVQWGQQKVQDPYSGGSKVQVLEPVRSRQNESKGESLVPSKSCVVEGCAQIALVAGCLRIG